ncbi:hypothetical protein GF406_06405 [candidate division KSB1 bacterium]|nr:hypothetical protein [candidate division KSB1 bacterium]
MNVPEINQVKSHLDELQTRGLVKEWELPYENILTRLTAAIFFIRPTEESKLDSIWKELSKHSRFISKPNDEKKLSQLPWRVEFNKDFEL